ncbi:MAG: beta-glucosidase [bacterium]|nr:beta-glucosidase [bacterium]
MDPEPYRRADLPIEERVEDLLARMTLSEKLAQIGCVWSTNLVDDQGFSEEQAREHLAHGIGHVTRLSGNTGLQPEQAAELMNRIQKFLVEESRLGIPAVVHEESCAGFLSRDATQFPQAIGLASTWEPELVEAMCGVIREQMRAVGALHTLAPVLDVARDPRWGRTEETFGEDPYLVGRMGVAYVRGLQTDDLTQGVVATGKHFLGYGAGEGGMNWAPAHIGERELREIYAVPFEAAIREAGLASMMNSYGEIDGVPCGASPRVLDDLLRKELGFEGVVVADYFTVLTLLTYHKIAATPGEAARIALEAGIDVELPKLECYGEPLGQMVESGVVPVEWVDRAVARLLRMKFSVGLFEQPFVDAERAAAVFDTPAQRGLARRIAQKSIVLLKNEAQVLPLDRDITSIAVIGPSSDSGRLLLGDYSYPAHLEILYEGEQAPDALAPVSESSSLKAGPYFVEIVSVLQGILSVVGDSTDVRVAAGCATTGDDTEGFAAAVEAARSARVAVVVVGGRSGLTENSTSGEFNDRADLGLPGVQEQLVAAVIATGTPTVVVLINGRPLALAQIAQDAAAILEAWLPGEEGGAAVADILFGDVNPAGRLPVSLPRSVGQVPVFYNHKPSGGRSQIRGHYNDLSNEPLFPFGFGLSYSTFEYANLEISPTRTTAPGCVSISADVRNIGPHDGEEVVQLYVNDVVASITRPVKQLVGFARIALDAGQVRRVRFELDLNQLAFLDAQMQRIIEPGQFHFMLGASSQDIRLEGDLEIEGKVQAVRSADLQPTRVEVQ